MWIIANYRSDEGATEFQPITPDQRFEIAFDHSFDPTASLLSEYSRTRRWHRINIVLSDKGRGASASMAARSPIKPSAM
jgi:hypothetical protein